jgi:NAD(P)-dependent dehydrogenase (short-subunit alcohol dehydrogenase family)
MKSVVVTGAERGVGKESVRVLLEEGYHVIAVSISLPNLADMKAEMVDRCGLPGERLDLIEFDLASVERIGHLVASIKGFLHPENPLWGYVNNAAIYYPLSKRSARLLDVVLPDAMEILNVNMISALLLSREMFRILKEGGKGGSIVFIASVAGKKGSVLSPVYGMSKAAIANLARSIAREGGADGIRANAISPGVMETQMGFQTYSSAQMLDERIKKNLIPRSCRPEEVAHLVAYLLSDHAGYITGEDLDLSGGSLIK